MVDPVLVVLFFGVMGVIGLVALRRRKPAFRRRRPVFDRQRREFRARGVSAISFRDLEIRVFRYPGRQANRSASTTWLDRIGGFVNMMLGTWWTAMLKEAPSGTEHRFRVYVRSGDTRVDLVEFRSKAEADDYADGLRELIRES